MDARQAYPVRIEGELEPKLSRWLWLVKWALAIPHYIVLAFLWLTLLVLTVVAFFAILFTGRYPRGIFDFNLGVLRWTWRVLFYSYGALATDRYPPFTLDDVPDYPARFHVEYPERLSRGLVLVKWWLLAIPHYIVVGIILGGGSYAASRAYDRAWGFGYQTGLVGVLVLFAGVALLFMSRYPPGIFDFVLGLDRWVARVAAYVLLMRDEYPPFRLDQVVRRVAWRAELSKSMQSPLRAPSPKPPRRKSAEAAELRGRSCSSSSASSPGSSRSLSSSAAAHWLVDQTQRDDDGFLMSPSVEFSTPTYAVVSESAELDTTGAEWALDTFLGTVRIRAESDRPVFVGIGSAAEVDAYLSRVDRDLVTDLNGRHPSYSRRPGGAPSGPPESQTFWAASASGAGEQTLEWEPEDGDWRAVVMNADATRGVSADMSIGAELDSVLWIGIGLLIAGALFAAGAALAITAGAHRRRS